jgi:hypothetical protein
MVQVCVFLMDLQTPNKPKNGLCYLITYKELNMSGEIQSSDLQALNETIRQLQETMQQKESNYEQLANAVRWGVLGFVAAIIMTGFVINDRISTAYAQTSEGLGQAQDVVDALNDINANLAIFGMVGQTLNQASPVIKDAMQNNKDIQDQTKQYLEHRGIPVNEENMGKYAPAAVVDNVVTTVVDVGILMQRVRQDSNQFRDLIENDPAVALSGIQQELEVLNRALSSVPVMAAQMDVMNRNMASMTHSMGSTMGRMGSWAPW